MNTIEIFINGQTVFEASCENDEIFDRILDVILFQYSTQKENCDCIVKRKFKIDPVTKNVNSKSN